MKNYILRLLSSRYFQIPAAILILYTIVGFLLIPITVGWYVPKYCAERLAGSAAIGKVRLNPFLLTLEVKDFDLKRPDGDPIAGFERLYLDFKLLGLFDRTTQFREFLLDKPRVNLVIEKDGSVNFPGLAPQSSEAPAPETSGSSPSAPPRLLFDTFSLAGGEFTMTDKRRSSPTTLAIKDLSLTFNSLTTIQNRNGTSSLSATTSDGETLQWQGEIGLVPFVSSGQITVSGLRATTPWAFLQDKVNLESPPGKLDFSADYRIDLSGPDPQLAVENFVLNLSEISLKLQGEEREFFELGKIELEPTSFDLASKSIHLGKLRAEGTKLRLQGDAAGRMNVARIVRSSEEDANKPAPDPSEAAVQKSQSESPPWKLTMDSIEIKDIESEVRHGQKGNPDQSFAAKLLAVDAAELDLAKQAITVSKIGLDSIEIKGIAKGNPAPLFTAKLLAVDAAELDIAKQAVKVARIGLDSVEIKDTASEVKQGQKGNPASLFATKLLAVEGAQIDLAKRAATVSRIGLDSGHMNAGLGKDGKTNFERIFAGGSKTPDDRAPKPAPNPGQAWKFLLKTFELTKFQSALSDYSIAEKPLYNINDLNVRLTEVDGKSPMGVQVNFGVAQGGKVGLQGKVDPSARSLEVKANVDDLVITPLGPYLTNYLTLALGSAAVSTEGVFRYGGQEKGPKLSYEGSFSLGNLKFTQPPSKETYLGWGNMQVPKLKLSLEPNNLVVEQVKLSKPVGEVIIAQDKTINLSKIVKEQPAPKTHPATSKTPKKPVQAPASSQGHKRGDGNPFPFNIGTILVNDGNVLFADLSLQPKFMARIHDLKGTITKLSSGKGAISKIQLAGGVDRYGHAKIDGSLDLSDYKRSTDMTVVFRNVEMSSITPYSGKFAGRRIKSGKLSMDLKYRIQGNKLEGDNKIIVDNLVLGEHVNSPDAVNLPLDLAVALLSDSNGRIDLGLPVSGDLSDPQFSLAPLVWKAFTALITKAVTAPFRALGALFGGGDAGKSADSVLFDSGKAELVPPEKEKLKKITEAMGKRPLLRLIVQGRYSPEEDGIVLKELGLRREIAKRLGIKFGPGEDPGIDFGDSKVRGALEKMFSDKFGGKALDEIDEAVKKGEIKPRESSAEKAERKKSKKRGIVSKTLSAVKIHKIVPGMKSPEQSEVLAAELFARLVESAPLPEKELLELATGRERAVMAELLKIGLTGDRSQTKEPEPAAGDEGLSAKLSLDSNPTTPP